MLITIVVTVAAVVAAAGAVIAGDRQAAQKVPVPIPVRVTPRRD